MYIDVHQGLDRMSVRLSKPFRPELTSEVIEMLEDFCNAHHGASATEIVNKAVREFIPKDLKHNKGASRKYDALRSARETATASNPSKPAKRGE